MGLTLAVLSNCNGDTRNILEGTIGFWYRFYTWPEGQTPVGTAVLLHRPQYLARRGWYSERDGKYVLNVVPLLLAVNHKPRLRADCSRKGGVFLCFED